MTTKEETSGADQVTPKPEEKRETESSEEITVKRIKEWLVEVEEVTKVEKKNDKK